MTEAAHAPSSGPTPPPVRPEGARARSQRRYLETPVPPLFYAEEPPAGNGAGSGPLREAPIEDIAAARMANAAAREKQRERVTDPWKNAPRVSSSSSLHGIASRPSSAGNGQASRVNGHSANGARSSRPLENGAASVRPGPQPLKPGTLLQDGRYRLNERQGLQEWLAGSYEAFWLAQDARRGGASVRITEFLVPDRDSLLRYSLVCSATMALHAVSRHSHVPTLLDVFSDQGRSFFVFEQVEGETLLARMRRVGHYLSEEEIVDCCLQMAEILEFMEQQSPPLVHGLIRPEHILAGRAHGHYVLVNFSVMLASGATQFVTDIARAQLSPYAAPEFAHGVVDARSDIYALLASAYHMATGSIPARNHGSVTPPRRFNAGLSPQFEAILMKGLYSGQGLRPDLSLRYRHAADLRQALLQRNEVHSTVTPAPERPEAKPADAPVAFSTVEPTKPREPDDELRNHPVLQSLADGLNVDEDEGETLLPPPESLPPLPDSNDSRKALLWLMSIFLCLVLTVAVAHGWM